MDEQSQRFGGTGQSIADLGVRISALDANLNSRINALDAKLDRRIDELDAKLDRRVDSLDARIDILDQKMSRQFLWLVGFQFTVLVAVIAALLGT